MGEFLKFENFLIEPIITEMEVNFTIYDPEGYQCRLVPGYWGLELSALDKCLGVEPDDRFVVRLSDFITNYYA